MRILLAFLALIAIPVLAQDDPATLRRLRAEKAEAANTLATLLRSAAFRHFAQNSWPNPILQADMLQGPDDIEALLEVIKDLGALGDNRAVPKLVDLLSQTDRSIASAGKDTEGSQFFITHSPQPHLDERYTIVGKVLDGLQVADAIQRDDRLVVFKAQQ